MNALSIVQKGLSVICFAAAIAISIAAQSALAQEVVLKDGKRVRGTVEKYENGLAYVLMHKENGNTMLTTLPESSIDKEATAQAQVANEEPVTSTTMVEEDSRAPREPEA